jgi:general secretion pathway protein A
MMRHFYDLKDDPFSPIVHPTWFFASRSHTAAVQTLNDSLQARQALALLLGEPGVGKTFLVHAALAHSVPPHVTMIHLWYPPSCFHETLQMIGWELGLKESIDDATQLTHALHRALLTEHERGRQIVLVMDEAHTLAVETLASLVRLSQVRALTGAPLLQMLLVGLPTLWRSFSAPSLRPCTPRTLTRVTLAPLSNSESQAYIRHRLQQAGASDGTVFTAGAVQHVARQARGNPRVMNELCTHLLLTGFASGHKPIATSLARNTLRAAGPTRFHPRRWACQPPLASSPWRL